MRSPHRRENRDGRRLLRCCDVVIAAAAAMVPRRRRADWAAEWRGELWHRVAEIQGPGAAPLRWNAQFHLLLRTLGTLPHALWVLRDEWRFDMLLHDLKYSLRTLAKRPGFTALVVVTLAVGIGANSAMFSIVNSVLIKPLPYARPGELVYMFGSFRGGDEAAISPPDFLDYRERNTVFSSVAARTFRGSAVLTGGTEPERVSSVFITANFFSTLGVPPVLGRAFLPVEERGDGHDVVIISYGLWQRQFGGDPGVLGRTLHLDGRALAVVGVMPAVLDRTLDVQVWRPIPFGTEEASVRRFHYLRGIGRLAADMSLAGAQQQLDIVARQLEAAYPENETWKLRLVPYRDFVVGNVGTALLVLLGAVGLVLLIACANVASLMLVRATARRGEIAVRIALGASRTRLVRQLLTESALLGLASGALGLAIAVMLVRAVRAVDAGILPRLAEIEVDGTALAVTVALSLLTGLLFGLAPALQAVRGELAAALRSLGKSSRDHGTVRLRDAMVVGQVALSLVLLVSAGLLLRSLWSMQKVSPGYDAEGLLTATIALPRAKYDSRPSHTRFWESFLDRVRSVPGVELAAGTTMLPLVGGGDTYFYPEKRAPASDADRSNAQINVVTDDYFRAMRIPLVAGRTFAAEDRDGAGVVVVSRALAQRVFPGQSAVGERLVVDFGAPFVATIVGVVGDVRAFGARADAPEIMYFTFRQDAAGWGTGQMSLVARARADETSLIPPLRAALAELEPDIPFADARTMEQLVTESTADASFRARLLASFAGLALALAVVGLYGILAYAVTQRAREMGIRIALGARSREVFVMVVWKGMALVAAGIALGLPAALGVTRLLEQLLFEVGRTDLAVYATVTVALATAGLAACLIPARRATRVDPMVALREE